MPDSGLMLKHALDRDGDGVVEAHERYRADIYLDQQNATSNTIADGSGLKTDFNTPSSSTNKNTFGHRNPHNLATPFTSVHLAPSPQTHQIGKEVHHEKEIQNLSAAELFELKLKADASGSPNKHFAPGASSTGRAEGFLQRLEAAEKRDKSASPNGRAVRTERPRSSMDRAQHYGWQDWRGERDSRANFAPNDPKRRGLVPESRSPPNFAVGSHHIMYKDSSLVPRIDRSNEHAHRSLYSPRSGYHDDYIPLW